MLELEPADESIKSDSRGFGRRLRKARDKRAAAARLWARPLIEPR